MYIRNSNSKSPKRIKSKEPEKGALGVEERTIGTQIDEIEKTSNKYVVTECINKLKNMVYKKVWTQKTQENLNRVMK